MNFLAPVFRRMARVKGRISSWALRDHYGSLYESHAQRNGTDTAVGNGPYDALGRMELEFLQWAGLKPNDTLLDFGCGDGRLAVHAIPALPAGQYIGIDIAPTFLDRARRRIAQRHPAAAARARWLRQTGDRIALPDGSVDLMCAFSVFTHMEHEDTYRYLQEARRVVRSGGRLVYSCLPMNLAAAQEVFAHQAALDFATRWRTVRNVTTSVDFMDAVAKLAGWSVVRWFPGNERFSRIPGEEARPFGQSVCVLEARKT